VPHLAAAYNLARWLTRDEQDAEDVVQEACLRALRFFDNFHGSDGRAWILAIVRNACYTWLRQNRREQVSIEDEMELHDSRPDPEALHLADVDRQRLLQAIEDLPAEFREAIILRELEGLSYKEIGAITGVPLGTVMSRLARARQRLEQTLAGRTKQGGVA
jgi:RNA polymerase sigma-70 factor (ECF subfamily)